MSRPPVSAHVLLHQEHAACRFDVEAAGIEAHALADQRDFRVARLAPAKIDQARRNGASATDRVDHRKILFQKCIAFGDGNVGLVFFRQFTGGVFEGIRPHVVGRRVDEVAHQRHRAGDAAEFGFVQAVRQGQSDRLAIGLAITREIIAAHQEAQNCKRCIIDRAVDMPVALREAARELSGQKLRLAGLFIAGPKQCTRYRSVRAGEGEHTSGFAIKAIGLGPCNCCGGKAGSFQTALRRKPDRAALFGFSGKKFDRHDALSGQ